MKYTKRNIKYEKIDVCVIFIKFFPIIMSVNLTRKEPRDIEIRGKKYKIFFVEDILVHDLDLILNFNDYCLERNRDEAR